MHAVLNEDSSAGTLLVVDVCAGAVVDNDVAVDIDDVTDVGILRPSRCPRRPLSHPKTKH